MITFKNRNLSLAMVSAMMFIACAAEPEGDPGLGSLDCSGAKLAAPEFIIEPVATPDSTECAQIGFSGGVARPKISVTLRFRVYANKKDVSGQDTKFFKAAISFNPIVGGNFDQEETNEENRDDAKYSGIRTPKSEWCTDSYGVGSIEVVPVCQQASDNNMSIQIQSGANFSEVVTFSFKKPVEEEG